MPTFYERLQLYQQRPDAISFSKKKLRRIRGCIATIYNRKVPIALQKFTESIEGDKTYLVKDYPKSFMPTIDGLLNRFHDDTLAAQPKPVIVKRVRKRIPFKKKPIWWDIPTT